MSSALEAVQTSLVASLQSHQPVMDMVTGIFDGPPARAKFPYIVMATGASLDWGHKTGEGRELSLALTVHDDGISAARLHRIMARIEEALNDGVSDPSDWQIVTFDFRRTRILRSAISPWNGLIEYRARCLKT
ncbi:MAG: DUF3168 domain-containing protein [Parasphingorhabdus sp.]